MTDPIDQGAASSGHAIDHAAARFVVPAGTLHLDCAARGPQLGAVLDAGRAALDASTSPWRMSDREWNDRIETLRADAAHCLFGGDTDGVAMVPSAAYGIATAARNLPLDRGDAVLVLDGQFPSNLLAWQQRGVERSARVFAAKRRNGQDWTAALFDALDSGPNVRIVALPHAYWIDGALLDLDRIAARVHDHGAALVLDLSQSLGALPVDLARWQPDFIVAVGHKWLLGAPGLAWLWASPRWRREGTPIEQHWHARAAADDWRYSVDTAPAYRAGARRFDAGSVAEPMRLAMAQAAMTQIQAWGVERIARHLAALTGALDDALDARGLSTWKTSGHAPHFTALKPPVDALNEIAAAFAREAIVCTRRQDVFRIAPHLHVGVDDMQRVVEMAADAGLRAARGGAS